jgi:hypothetical protein
MPNHLILSFESFAADAPEAIFHWAEMGPCLAVHVGVGANRSIPLTKRDFGML